MRTTIDSAGRVVILKALREAVGLVGGATVDVSLYGRGLALTPSGRTATVRRDGDHLVVDSPDTFTDEILFGLIDAGRR